MRLVWSVGLGVAVAAVACAGGIASVDQVAGSDAGPRDGAALPTGTGEDVVLRDAGTDAESGVTTDAGSCHLESDSCVGCGCSQPITGFPYDATRDCLSAAVNLGCQQFCGAPTLEGCLSRTNPDGGVDVFFTVDLYDLAGYLPCDSDLTGRVVRAGPCN